MKRRSVVVPVNGERFVDRFNELEMVRKIVSDARQGRPTLKRGVVFQGVQGLGKTSIIQHLYKSMQGDDCLVVLIDFADASGVPQKDFVRERIVEPLQKWVEQSPPSELNEALKYTLERIGLSNTALLLMFDTIEQMQEDTFAWLEEAVIAPLIGTGKVVVILAGRKPVTWTKFEISSRVDLCRLEPFKPASVEMQIYEYAHLANQIADLTFGHPLANELLTRKLRRIERSERIKVSKEYIEQHREQLLQYLMDQLIERWILSELEDGVSEAVKASFILRHFDINALRYFVTKFAPAAFHEYSGVHFLHLLGKMVDSGLVTWDAARRGYVLDTAVRRIMFLHKRYSDPQRFGEMNETAAGLYALWIEQLSENRGQYIIEYLFHKANAMLAKTTIGPSDIGEEIETRLQEYIAKYYTDRDLGVSGLMNLREAFSRDDEFLSLVPVPVQKLYNVIGNRISRLQGEE